MRKSSRDEMETTITFNRYRDIAECCTADPSVARRWQRAGLPVEVLGRYQNGEPRTWQMTVPWQALVKFPRALKGGTGR